LGVGSTVELSVGGCQCLRQMKTENAPNCVAKVKINSPCACKPCDRNRSRTHILVHADIFTYRMTDEMVAEVHAHVVERAADIFGLLSSPVRLHIVLELRAGEKSVSELLVVVNGKQPNMSQHLTMMCRAGLLGRRKQGAQVYYRIANQSAVSACKIVCAQVVEKSDRRFALPAL
jgi:DNA-binding transcriptional ArsR family regulator